MKIHFILPDEQKLLKDYEDRYLPYYLQQHHQISTGQVKNTNDIIIKDADIIVLQQRFDYLNLAKKYPEKKFIYILRDNLWDIPRVFELKSNITDDILMVEDTMIYSNAIIVTNENLKSLATNFNDNIYLYPDCIQWINHEKSIKKDIIIGVILDSAMMNSSLCHSFVSALSNIIHKYKTVKVICFGYVPKELKNKVLYVPYLYSYIDNIKMIEKYDFDICLMPLSENEFNVCRSDSFFLEYSKIKALTIASNIESYNKLKHIILVNNHQKDWESKISYAIENLEERLHIANLANEWVYNNRIYNEKTVQYLLQIFDSVYKMPIRF